MSLNSSGGDGASSVLHVPSSDLDYERRLIVLIASAIGCVAMAGIFTYIMWGLCKNRRTIQKIYDKQANPKKWPRDENEAENGLTEGADLLDKKSSKTKNEHSSEETNTMLVEEKGGENPGQTVLLLLDEDKSSREVLLMGMSMSKSRV